MSAFPWGKGLFGGEMGFFPCSVSPRMRALPE